MTYYTAEPVAYTQTHQTIPYAPCPSSLVTVYRSSTMKSWLNTLKTLRPWSSDMLSAWQCLFLRA